MCLSWIEGQALAAAARYLVTRYSTASALRRVPRAAGNSSCPSPRGGSRNHAFKTATVDFGQRGTSFFPSLADHAHVGAGIDYHVTVQGVVYFLHLYFFH
jgi:hypothetical protein